MNNRTSTLWGNSESWDSSICLSRVCYKTSEKKEDFGDDGEHATRGNFIVDIRQNFLLQYRVTSVDSFHLGCLDTA